MQAITVLVLALRGAAAILVLTTLVGGIPRIVQLGLAIVFGLWTACLVGTPAIDEGLALVAMRELIVGATLGIVAVIPLVAAAMAGRLVDVAGNARGPYGALFGVLAAAVFVGIDGHVAVVAAIADSFVAVPALADTQPRVLAAIGGLVMAAVRLAVPWLVTAAVVELAVGVGTRVAGRAGLFVPRGAAVPAALAMMTAALVATLAVAIAALVRGAL
ncbi:MAG: Bacterial export protein, family 1 [Deltaproteobacteria bacterium]|nr:Bacterial export protein, family 1 [Deltaproteobacteria bacterium]